MLPSNVFLLDARQHLLQTCAANWGPPLRPVHQDYDLLTRAARQRQRSRRPHRLALAAEHASAIAAVHHHDCSQTSIGARLSPCYPLHSMVLADRRTLSVGLAAFATLLQPRLLARTPAGSLTPAVRPHHGHRMRCSSPAPGMTSTIACSCDAVFQRRCLWHHVGGPTLTWHRSFRRHTISLCAGQLVAR